MKGTPFSTLSHNPWHAGRLERWLLRNRFTSHKSRSIFAAIGTERVIYTLLFMFKADGQHMIARDRVVGLRIKMIKINLYPLEWLCFLLL